MFTIQISAHLITFPQLCCCCGQSGTSTKYRAESTRTTGKRVVRHDTRYWDFPLCDSCNAWIAIQKSKAAYATRFWIFLIFFFIANGNNGGGWTVAWGLATSLSAVGWFFLRSKGIKKKRADLCVYPPVKYLGWQGSVHTFDLSNAEYWNALKALNSKKLVG